MTRLARAPLAPTAGSASASDETMPNWMKNYKSIDQTTPDKTDKIREEAAKVRELRLEEKELEARLTEIHKDINKIERQVLPELMDAAGSRRYDLEAEGNKPAYSVRMKNDIYANVSVKWEDEKRTNGYAVIRALGGGPLIKNTIVLHLGRQTDELAQRIHKGLLRVKEENPDAAMEIEHDERVQHNTLSAWLETLINKGKEPTQEQLEAIGARVGRIAVVKPLKDS